MRRAGREEGSRGRQSYSRSPPGPAVSPARSLGLTVCGASSIDWAGLDLRCAVHLQDEASHWLSRGQACVNLQLVSLASVGTAYPYGEHALKVGGPAAEGLQ